MFLTELNRFTEAPVILIDKIDLVFFPLQESYFCVFVERGFLVLQGQQMGREIRRQSAENVSLFVRWSSRSNFTAVPAFWMHVFVLFTNWSTKIVCPASGSTVYNRYCKKVWSALRTKRDLHRPQSNKLRGLLHRGSAGTAQTEVTKQMQATFTFISSDSPFVLFSVCVCLWISDTISQLHRWEDVWITWWRTLKSSSTRGWLVSAINVQSHCW